VKSKEEIRQEIWDLLEERNVVAFPRSVYGRIPNFIGANVAAEKLREISIWRKARVVKSNPDAPQKWVREIALKQGKTVYMAFPRLKQEKCFFKIDPKSISSVSKASTIKGAFRYGEPVFPEDMDMVDIIIVGSVAVNTNGAKLGKGGGFSDLEYAIAREFEKIDEYTPAVTTVHQLQIIEDEIPMENHDVPLDYIVTRDSVITTDTTYQRPDGIAWDIVGGKINEIPVLKILRAEKNL
jgi:5-formyltetrahydrofolate cyclo-ligase